MITVALWPFRYPINVNNGCPGNVELQDVWMPRPAWSVGGRYNADGSAGTTPDDYTHFGTVLFDKLAGTACSYVFRHSAFLQPHTTTRTWTSAVKS